MADIPNHVMHAIRRLSGRSEANAADMEDFTRRQANGEQPDPNEFVKLLQLQSTNNDVMTAQFKLVEKPLRTVLQEAK